MQQIDRPNQSINQSINPRNRIICVDKFCAGFQTRGFDFAAKINEGVRAMMQLVLVIAAAVFCAAGAQTDLENCLRQGKVYWAAKGTCQTLPDLTICERKGWDWLVLDADKVDQEDRFEPRCKPKPCDGSLEVFWPPIQNCTKMSNVKCPKGNELKTDMYGEGSCVCHSSPVHLPLSLTESNAPCYKLYTRGGREGSAVCPEDQVLHAQHIKDKGRIAVCQADPCAEKNKKWKRRTYAQDPINSVCYALGSRGPCNSTDANADGAVFDVSPITYLPDCVVSSTQLALFNNVPRRCITDKDKTACKSAIEVQEANLSSNKWELEMTVKRKLGMVGKKARSRR